MSTNVADRVDVEHLFETRGALPSLCRIGLALLGMEGRPALDTFILNISIADPELGDSLRWVMEDTAGIELREPGEEAE